MKLVNKISEVLNNSLAVKKKHSKGLFSQYKEIYKLSKFPNCLSQSEYYQFHLYDDELFTAEEKNEFIGYKGQRIYEKLNHPAWHALANDKMVFHTMMQANNFKTPKIIAYYHNGKRLYTAAQSLKNISDLTNFFESNSHFPLFIKPIHGVYGKGTYLISEYDKNSQSIHLSDGRNISLSEFHRLIEEYIDEGIIFQSKLEPSAEITEYCGNRLSSVRLIVLLTDDGPCVFRANWKIPTGDNITDNTQNWSNGNIVAAVDHTNGNVTRAFCGDANKGIYDVKSHPDTHKTIINNKVPHWDEMTTYVLKAAPLFPGIRFQGWDIVGTSDGIMSLEVNLVTMATVLATQLVTKNGFLDHQLRKELNLP